ncbi:MAG: mRNA surveillance protein pelota [Nanoarchaeota archaeon]|nr:mRNA surveillance protein pelota [Nanoarchaeota archaeon]
MNLLHSDFKKGIVKLRVTDSEDLWYLTHLIDPGDLVSGKTTRKMKLGEGENAKTIKKTFTVTIEAETIQLDENGTCVRINGKIKEGPDEIPQGVYQAVELQEGEEFILQKVKWLSYQKQKLQEATEKKYSYLMCLFDREEALFALTKKKGFQILVELHGEAQKKRTTIEIKKDFYEEIIKALETYNARYTPEAIILSSPAFYKEDLLKKITAPELKKKIVLVTCSDISERSLDEVIKSPELEKTMQTSRTRQEQVLVDEVLQEISKNNLAVYGWKETKTASEAGAIRILIVTDALIHTKKLAGDYAELDSIMKHIDDLQGEIHILSSEQETGKRIDGLGGIAALLRYKMKW